MERKLDEEDCLRPIELFASAPRHADRALPVPDGCQLTRRPVEATHAGLGVAAVHGQVVDLDPWPAPVWPLRTGQRAGYGKITAPVLVAVMRRANVKDLARLKRLVEADAAGRPGV